MLVFCVVLLPACARRTQKRSLVECVTVSRQQPAHTKEFVRAWEVAVPDVPLPLEVDPVSFDDISKEQATGQHFFAYTTVLSEAELIAFYEQEMERLGWQKLAFVHDFEVMLIFAKPDRICSVSLRVSSEEGLGRGDRTLAVVNIAKKTQALSFSQAPENYDEDFCG